MESSNDLITSHIFLSYVFLFIEFPKLDFTDESTSIKNIYQSMDILPIRENNNTSASADAL